jgi:guanylate cyclase
VALKKVHKRSIDLTRSIKKELKLMREVRKATHENLAIIQVPLTFHFNFHQLRHENIVGFVGASCDNSNIFILTNYCARGSLENVLANEDLKLDNMFVSSLVFDIMKGLIFLHDSEIVSHGNLRSSNCLVDSRWCVKLTDFGLNEFKVGNDEPDK